MQMPAIKSVKIEKSGRFWAVNVDESILAIVLYKRGALAIQELVCGLSGLPKPEDKSRARDKTATNQNAKAVNGETNPKPAPRSVSKPKTGKAKTKKPSTPKPAKKS